MILFVDKMVATEESLQEQPEQVPSDPDGELTKKILKWDERFVWFLYLSTNIISSIF